MPYLPPPSSDPTTFPDNYGKDLWAMLRFMRERWMRHFPYLFYYSLAHAPTPAGSPNVPTGDPGTTKYDPLWNEPVDPAMTTIQQPHGTAFQAAEPYVYRDAVRIPCRVNRQNHQTDLQRWGFDKMRDLIVAVPCVILDDYGITVRAGDKFKWRQDTFRVAQATTDGYWRNSSLPLYVVMNAQTLRHGS